MLRLSQWSVCFQSVHSVQTQSSAVAAGSVCLSLCQLQSPWHEVGDVWVPWLRALSHSNEVEQLGKMPFWGVVWTENKPGTSKDLNPWQGAWKIGLGTQRNRNLADTEGNGSPLGLAHRIMSKKMFENGHLFLELWYHFTECFTEGFQSTIQIFPVNHSSYTTATWIISGLNGSLKKYFLRIRLGCIVCHLQENKTFSCVKKSNKGWRVGIGRVAFLFIYLFS